MPIHEWLSGWQNGEIRTVLLLENDGRLTEPVRLLLGAVSGVPDALLRSARVYPKEQNWLRFPWYAAAKGGGAFVMGDRIYAHRRFFRPENAQALLHLLAHEVGHLLHAQRFGATAWGRTRFVCWAAGHYFRSGLLHGRNAHRLARIEQEAERGRWVLRELSKRTGSDPLGPCLADAVAMRAWVSRNMDHIDVLQARYAGWTTDRI